MIMPFRLVLVATALVTVMQASPPGFIIWSLSELEQRDAALATSIGPDRSARETLADYGNPSGAHRFRFIRRDADGVPEQHEHIEDVVFIQSGGGTLLVGGSMVNRTGGDGEYTGTGIAGGVRHPVGPGDIIHIPADTPHRYLVPDGGHVTYVLVRLPVIVGEPVVPADAPDLEFDPPGFAMWSDAELARRDAALATRVGPDHSARETLADYGSPTRSHRFRFIHRDADGRPEIHDDIIDVVFVTSGAGDLLVGGEMLNRTGGLGTGITGGERFPVAAGDMLHIPAMTPHGYMVPEGGHITYVLARFPAFSGEAR
jgi:mannose-6-phosphate isomerase-like protein (cupin superfamily)